MSFWSFHKVKASRAKAMVMGALALVCVSGLVQSARAQAAVTIGVVDEEKLGQSYKKYRDAVSEIEKRAQALDEQLASRLWLTAEEGKKFDELINKSNRSGAEEADLKNLVTSGKNRQDLYNGLVGKVNKNDEDKTQMKTIETQAETNKAGLQTLQDSLYAKMKKEQEDTDKSYTDNANKVIQQVAEKKNLSLVVRKVAVVWSAASIDITDDVLKQLNG